MSPRGFIILLLVTILAVAGAVVAAVRPTISGTEAVAGSQMFPALAERPAEAAKVAVTTPQYSATWERRDGVWVSPERGNYPGLGNLVPDLVAGLSRLTKVEAKTADPNWYQYIRVGDPASDPPTGVAHVTVSSADGKVMADAILGARSFSIPASHGRGGMFVRDAKDAQSWLVEGSASVPTGLPEWFDTLVDIPGPEITGVTILAADRTLLDLKKTDQTNGVYEIAQLDPAEASADSVANNNSIRSLASAIVGLRFDDVRAKDSVSVGDDARTVRFTMTSGMLLDVTVFKVDGASWATFEASAPAGGAGAEAAALLDRRTENWAFLLNESRAVRLSQPVVNLVQKPADPAAGGAGAVAPGQNEMPAFAPQGDAPGFGLPGGAVLPTF